jgi:hypothetical protein
MIDTFRSPSLSRWVKRNTLPDGKRCKRGADLAKKIARVRPS